MKHLTRLEKILLAITAAFFVLACFLFPRTEASVRTAPAYTLPGPSPAVPGEAEELWVTLTKRIDINHADEAELTALPGVGAVTARAIVEYREANGPFFSVEELLLVPGVKEATVRALLGEETVPEG